MTKQIIDKQENLNCCECSSLKKNIAHLDLSTNKLTIGICEFGKKRMKDIAFQFAHDLMDYFDNGGDLNNLSAKKVYSLLADIFKTNN